MNTLIRTNVTIMVSQMEPAIHFYTEVLGLTLTRRYGDHFAEIESPGVNIALHPSDKYIKGNNLSIGFGVTDFDSTVAELEAKGITLQVSQEGYVRLAQFNDPDGNPLYLAALKEEPE